MIQSWHLMVGYLGWLCLDFINKLSTPPLLLWIMTMMVVTGSEVGIQQSVILRPASHWISLLVSNDY